MASVGALTAQPLDPGRNFNWVFLVELLVCGILVLFFLFYFNRLFATLVSYAVRAYTWHKFRVYVDVQSVQISLLGGRIFFKGIRYHGENETIRIHHGYITWQYWLRSTKQVDLNRFKEVPPSTPKSNLTEKKSKESSEASGERISEAEVAVETGPIGKSQDLPSRISIHVTGLEWFVYNRSPAYDAIIEQQARPPKNNTHDKNTESHGAAGIGKSSSQASSNSSDNEKTEDDGYNGGVAPEDRQSFESARTRSTTTSSQQLAEPKAPLILRILPIWIECHKGAIALGNETTKAILVTTFNAAKGHIDASGSGPEDIYRQIFDFDIEHPLVQMKPNPDYKQSQRATAERIISRSELLGPKKRKWKVDLHVQRRRRKVTQSLRNLVPRFRSSVESFRELSQEDHAALHVDKGHDDNDDSPWMGLSRYLDDDETDHHAAWTNVEYAKVSTVLDCPSIQFVFYWDTPGLVTSRTVPGLSSDINGSEPPGYGLRLMVRGGNVRYGPWHDRLRAEIQNAFFPNPYLDAQPAERLASGSLRQYTVMNINVELEEEVTLIVPCREGSKDWQWKGRASALRSAAGLKRHKEKKHFRLKKGEKGAPGPDIRPFGWISFYVDANSTVAYIMDMLPRHQGFVNHLELDLKGTRATSSVNHANLWRCGPQQLFADLSNPLGWNKLHSWVFDIRSKSMELFLLRDHCNLLVDMIGDFTAGVGADFMTFVPFQYDIKIFFSDLKLYLNANDSNIIESPCEIEENTFLLLGAETLKGNVGIPLQDYSPVRSSVLFAGDGQNVRMELTTPLWSTLHTFVSDHPVAILKSFATDGSYNFYSATSPQLTDTLIMNINGMAPKIYLHGFLIKYFMSMKENYFGDSIHFKTLEDFQDLLSSEKVPTDQSNHAHSKNDNDLDVILNVRADRSCVLLPANIYSRKDNVRFDILLIEADMRFTNYYMDLAVNSSPIEASLESLTSEEVGAYGTVSNTQLFVDGVRVYGHRMFGAPPSEPTYVCNWDFDVGKIVGECSGVFVRTLAFAAGSFAFTLDDDENALPMANTAIVHDVTFVRAQVESISIWLLIDEAALLLSTGHIDVGFNDWAGYRFSDRVHALVPDVVVGVVDLNDAVRHRGLTAEPVTTHACFQTSIDVRIVDQKADFAKNRALQQQHVKNHDQRTHRTDWLLHKADQGEASRRQRSFQGHLPTLPLPPMPYPAIQAGNYKKSDAFPSEHVEQPQVRHKSSFLSQDSARRADSRAPASAKPSSTQHARIPDRRTARITTSQQDGNNTRREPGIFRSVAADRKDTTTDPTSSASVTFSSPWSPPYFRLQDSLIDKTELPAVPSGVGGCSEQSHNDAPQDYNAAGERARMAHTSILLDVRPGVVGFGTPQAFHAVAALMRYLEPAHPADLLDQLQVETMSKILKLAKLKSKVHRVTDLSIRIPFAHLRLIDTYLVQREGQEARQRDQYDFVLVRTAVMLRLKDHSDAEDDDPNHQEGIVVHTQAKEISFAVSEKSTEAANDKASVRGTVTDVGFWMSSQKEINMKLQMRSIEVAIWSKQIEYLASLIHHTGLMIERIINDFKLSDQSGCVRHLVYQLTVEGVGITDPVFLTKPSYVLRSAGDHFRQNDSWKIISRLRFLYNSLPKDVQERIVEAVADHHTDLPVDAEDHVLSTFDLWRNWDHGHIQKSFIMDRIWGNSASPAPRSQGLQPLHAGLSIGSSKFVLDPGPNQNEVVLGDIETAVSITKPHGDRHGTPYINVSASQRVSIQSYCSQVSVYLNWNLVKLVGDTLQEFQSRPTQVTQSTTSTRRLSQSIVQTQEYQVVFGTDSAMIAFESINVTLAMAAEKLRGSVILGAINAHNETSTLALSASSASTKLKDCTDVILGWRLSLPVINASYVCAVEKSCGNRTLKIAGICHRLRFDLKQDVMKVLNTVHQVIDEEVELIQKLLSKVTTNSPSRNQDILVGPTNDIDVDLAFFLDDYKLSIALLPSLTYVIFGQVARTSIRAGRAGKITVDFDIKRHRHSFRAYNRSNQSAISMLEIPPINGRVIVISKNSLTSIDVDTTLEKIELETAAVRSCIDTINQPEIGKLAADAKTSGKKAVTKVQRLFASTTPNEAIGNSDKRSGVLHYAARATLDGLLVHCIAPGIQSQDYRADFSFGFDLATIHIHNGVDPTELIYESPQFETYVRKIGFELGRRSQYGVANYGKLSFSVQASGATEIDDKGDQVQNYRLTSDGFFVDLYTETASLIVDVAAFLQERFKSLTLADEVRQIRPLRRLTMAGVSDKADTDQPDKGPESDDEDIASSMPFDSVLSLNLGLIQIRWIIPDRTPHSASRESEDLVFSIRKIDLSTKREGSARLTIADLQLQMVPKSADLRSRSSNSALLPEVIFSVAHIFTKQDRRFAFQAAGKALDLRLASDFIVPASILQKSLAVASKDLREAKSLWASGRSPNPKGTINVLGGKRLASLLVDADFAGAVVNIQARREAEPRSSVFGLLKGKRRSRASRYGQVVQGDAANEAVLRAPGIALKVEYRDTGKEDPSLSGQMKVAASTNVLYPSVVPLIIEISTSVKEIVGDDVPSSATTVETPQTQSYLREGSLGDGDPSTILGRCKLNLGLLIREQEFSLSCQPIARVAATARFDSIFMTVNTVQSQTHQRFFASVVTFNKLQASVQHVYSRESTASFEVDSIVMSLMNSKHVSTTRGLSAILNISPMSTVINAKQLQDFLLFREIWYPQEFRQAPMARSSETKERDTQAFAVRRYQQVAAASAFPWNAVVSVQELKVQLDLGQGLGKCIFTISKLWASSKKNSDWEQNLCAGFEKVGVESTGRMSGFVELQDFRVRTSIRWPLHDEALQQTPIVQASLGFDQLRVKAAFDYQPFAVADISTLEFLMYNVRPTRRGEKDRLVGILDGDKVQVYCTTSTASQALALYQAVERLIQEREAAYEGSLRELDKHLRRKSVFPSSTWTEPPLDMDEDQGEVLQTSISLHTDVVVTLKAVNVGAFPSTFFDNQIFKVEANDAQARFAVSAHKGRTHSSLGLTLGQLRVALANVNRSNAQALGEVSVNDVIDRATGSRGGTILKVPKVVASMQTWQIALSNNIDYIFKSTFEGKVDVGWNYSRISFIRGMWSAHARALAHRLGKPLPQSKVKITGGPQPDDPNGKDLGQDKITAVVEVPQSKYEYMALEPPIIDTPQLRDMGEATPPLEWIGLHRDRLPNLTHQIIIVTLQELAKEVEDAYSKILGST